VPQSAEKGLAILQDAVPATNLGEGLSSADLRNLTHIWQHPLIHNPALRDVTASSFA